MSKTKPKYSGFTSYLTTHTFTPEFIHDYKYWCWKIFKRWTLFTDFDNFYSICWNALLSKINEFDPNIATIQTFCISRINNEALRLWTNNKQQAKRGETDCDNPVIQNELIARSETDIYEMFSDFERYANSLGVEVNLEELYAEYTNVIHHELDDKEKKMKTTIVETPAMIAFAAWRAMRKDIGGRNDIQSKKQRRTSTESSN